MPVEEKKEVAEEVETGARGSLFRYIRWILYLLGKHVGSYIAGVHAGVGRGIFTVLEACTRAAGADKSVAIVEDNAPEPDMQHFKSGYV